MLTFFNDNKIKEKYLKRLEAHYVADEIVQGQYWEDGKGCAVGCTIHGNDHQAYEDEFGAPRTFADLEERIFEGLSNADSKEFPLEFFKAIPVGVDLKKAMVLEKFLHWLLVDPEDGIIKYTENKKVVQDVADLLSRKIAGEEVSSEEWEAMRKAAAAAADAANAARAAYADAYADAAAARAAADDAAYAAAAYADAAAANAAADAANAAYAAYAAAYAAAADAAYKKLADKLIELLKEAK